MQAADLVTRQPAVRFRRRPIPLTADQRAVWRMAALLVLLRCAGRGATSRSSLRRLHVLSWGSRSEATHARLMEQLTNANALAGAFVGVDPALNLAIDFAAGEGLVTREAHGRVSLTPDGKTCADEVIGAGLLAAEVDRAVQLKGVATESNINKLLRRAVR